MEIKKIASFLLIIIMLSLQTIVFAAGEWDGLLDIVPKTISGTTTSYFHAFDNDPYSSYSMGSGGGHSATINLSIPCNIQYFKIKGTIYSLYVLMYDSNDNVLYSSKVNIGFNQISNFVVNKSGIKKIYMYSVASDPNSNNVFEFEIYGTTQQLESPVLVYQSTVKKINVSWNSVSNAQKYKVYLNNVFQAETIDLSYTFENLIPDTDYTVKVEAVADGWAPASSTVTVRTKSYFSAPPQQGDTNVTDRTAKIQWSAVEDTKYYEVRLGTDGQIIQTNDLSYIFENLDAETEYTAYVRQVNLSDIASEWTVINFKTLPPPEVPPPKPDNLTLLEKGEDYIKVEVSETLYAQGYNFYLNNSKVTSQQERIYTFENLNPGTVYSVSVRAFNQYGESRFPTGLIVQTDEPKIPTVTNVTNSWSGSGGFPSKQTVSWDAKYVQQGFRVKVNGTEIGTYGPDVRSAEIDFNQLGLEPGLHEVEVVPLDQNGKSYTLKVNTKSTGNQDFDKILGYFTDGLNYIKKAGNYFLLGIISFVVLFLVIVFLFNKWKLGLITRNPEQLEANPDQALKNELVTSGDPLPNNPLDVQTYKAAKDSESGYYKQKEENGSTAKKQGNQTSDYNRKKGYNRSKKASTAQQAANDSTVEAATVYKQAADNSTVEAAVSHKQASEKKQSKVLKVLKFIMRVDTLQRVKGRQKPRRYYYFDEKGNKYAISNADKYFEMKAKDYVQARESGNWEKYAQKYNSQPTYQRLENQKFKEYVAKYSQK
jgi:hypothetical protein